MQPKTPYRRPRGGLTVMSVALLLTVAAVLGFGNPATAADSTTLDLPAGLACAFRLSVEIRGGNQVMKEFEDKNGNVVRKLSAGKGSALSFTQCIDATEDPCTGATFSLKANGSVIHTTVNPDGSSTVADTGHNVVILFPTDVPPGPSTTLYVGRLVFTISPPPDNVFTVQSFSGHTTDICDALSD
jgi:hypothetical protein